MKNNSHNLLTALAVAFLTAAVVQNIFAHAGHDKAPGEDAEASASGPITISAEAKKNLALQVEEAELRTIEKTFMAIGQIEPIPNRSAAVSSSISGRVTELKHNPGDMVKKGQVMIEVESRQIGNPPPRVQYAAPMDGVVTDRHVVLGDTVEPDKHLMEIVDLAEVYAEGKIFEGQVAAIKIGQKVRVTVESYPTNVFTGTVDLLSGTLDAETRTLKVWVRIKNPDLQLRPNMRARLNIVTAEAASVVTVPHSAVLGEAGNLFVFVQSDTDELVYQRKPIVVGMKDDRYMEVIEGVLPSDKVVTLGNYQLQYITTRTPATKPTIASTGNNENAKGTASPWFWMGLVLGALLLSNLMVALLKRRASAPAAVSNPPTESASK